MVAALISAGVCLLDLVSEELDGGGCRGLELVHATAVLSMLQIELCPAWAVGHGSKDRRGPNGAETGARRVERIPRHGAHVGRFFEAEVYRSRWTV